jgi:hypothetical protein
MDARDELTSHTRLCMPAQSVDDLVSGRSGERGGCQLIIGEGVKRRRERTWGGPLVGGGGAGSRIKRAQVVEAGCPHCAPPTARVGREALHLAHSFEVVCSISRLDHPRLEVDKVLVLPRVATDVELDLEARSHGHVFDEIGPADSRERCEWGVRDQ